MENEFWKGSPFGENSIFHPNWDLQKNNVNKKIEIEYVSCTVDNLNFNLTFKITASNLLNENATIYLGENEFFGSQTAIPKTKIKINANGITNTIVSFSKDKKFSKTWFEGDFEFIATITCDGLSAETDEFDFTCTKKTDNKVDVTPIKVEKYGKVKIVMDPGHGYTKGSTGASCFVYTHKIKDINGNPLVDSENKFITVVNDITKLPPYVLNEPDAWIVSKKEDQEHNERGLVFDVSIKLKELLGNIGFSCFITRSSKVIVGNDNEKTRTDRINLANINKADYFISIHADGVDKNNTITGSHVIYPSTKDPIMLNNCKELAKDIFTYYNIINVEKTSPKIDIRGLQILGTSNLTPRKILVELGFVTSPKDANLLFSSIDIIAKQLFDGILLNVNKYY